ncbi:MAG: hypothetical protein ACE5HJ_06020 [Thermoplasmata archaeon]
MRKHKTTLLLDADVWRAFQEEVMRHHGARATSAEVEKLLGGGDPATFAVALESVFPRPPGGFPSLEEIEDARPHLHRELAGLIREERDERDDRVLGL